MQKQITDNSVTDEHHVIGKITDAAFIKRYKENSYMYMFKETI
jgi:hypothetical protein